MRKSLITLVAASSVAVALVTAYRGRGPLARLVSNLQLLWVPRVLQLRISRLLQLRILSACALLWTAALL